MLTLFIIFLLYQVIFYIQSNIQYIVQQDSAPFVFAVDTLLKLHGSFLIFVKMTRCSMFSVQSSSRFLRKQKSPDMCSSFSERNLTKLSVNVSNYLLFVLMTLYSIAYGEEIHLFKPCAHYIISSLFTRQACSSLIPTNPIKSHQRYHGDSEPSVACGLSDHQRSPRWYCWRRDQGSGHGL